MLLKATAAEDDYNMIFVLAEAAHFLGIGTLAYKLWARQTVAGTQSPLTI